MGYAVSTGRGGAYATHKFELKQCVLYVSKRHRDCRSNLHRQAVGVGVQILDYTLLFFGKVQRQLLLLGYIIASPAQVFGQIAGFGEQVRAVGAYKMVTSSAILVGGASRKCKDLSVV